MNNTVEKKVLEESSNSKREELNIKDIMKEIRAKIRESAHELRDKREVFRPFEIDNSNSKVKAGDILHSDELSYLNQNYNYMPSLELEKVQSHRFGFFGKFLVKLKRKVLVTVWEFILKDYFERERQFQAKLVKLLNDQVKYNDARDADNFWELIRKIDVDVSNLSTRFDEIQDEYLSSLQSLEKKFNNEVVFETNSKLGGLNSELAKIKGDIATLDSVTRGLESISANNKKEITIKAASSSDITKEEQDTSYLLLENRYRGTEEDIKERQKFYVDYFKNLELPVLEIGPGRGELQELFKENDIKAYGVDMDKAMVEHSTNLGLDVRLGDGIKHLASLEDESLSGIIAIQVVEHLDVETIESLAKLANKKLVSGGRIILETINPISLLALSSHYFRDPTHVQPLHPETLEYVLSLNGFVKDEIKFLSELSESNQLLTLGMEESMPVRWQELISRYNHNVNKLNNVIFGFMDYCIVAKKA